MKAANSKPLQEISWRAAEYNYSRKDTSWYWLIIGISMALIIIALWQRNFFFALFIALAAGVLIALSRRKPQIFEFKVSEEGLRIGDKIFYNYENLESFSIHNRPNRLDEIVLKRKTSFNPFIKISIDSKTLIETKKILVKKLPETKYQESFIDIISDWLKL